MQALFVIFLAFLLSEVASKHCTGTCQQPATDSIMAKVMPHKLEFLEKQERNRIMKEIKHEKVITKAGGQKCENGRAGDYPCKKVDLVGFLSHSAMGSRYRANNDIWGWTDPSTGKEYALVGQKDQTAFVDVTDGKMTVKGYMKHKVSTWSDMKVFKNHMYIGTEASYQGIQVFDLTRLRDSTGSQEFKPDFVYDEVTSSHNVVINEATGYLYVVGSRTCRGGLHIADLNKDPKKPEFVGCYSADGYTHDAQCVIYNGPHAAYKGHEICFNYNEDTLTIVDVTDKNAIKQLARAPYTGSRYTHQGWLTDDHKYVLLDDELDEQRGTDKRTHTYLWDVMNLEAPKHFADYYSTVHAIDHNLYVKGKYAYMSNYEAGLRIVDLSKISEKKLTEVAFFDVHPESDSATFDGVWSSYIYFASGNIAVNSIDRGLFLVKPHDSLFS